jgi:hypothetical protein
VTALSKKDNGDHKLLSLYFDDESEVFEIRVIRSISFAGIVLGALSLGYGAGVGNAYASLIGLAAMGAGYVLAHK